MLSPVLSDVAVTQTGSGRLSGSMKKTCLLLCFALRAAAAEPPVMAASGAFFAVSVADLKASAQWYTEKLGLRAVMQTPKQD